ncbi:unnamed protein product [Peniophora sp. CBMAI 1063]|nr:unnamed protein product [Peniophora sp. CBMAI 1063]
MQEPVRQESLSTQGLREHNFIATQYSALDGEHGINTILPDLHWLRGYAGTTAWAGTVANAILRRTPKQVLSAMPRHMFTYLPRCARERLDLRESKSARPERGGRPCMDAFLRRGTGNSPLALNEEDFVARRQRRQRREASLHRLAKWKNDVDLRSTQLSRVVQDLQAASTRSLRASQRRFYSQSLQNVVRDIQELLASMRALLWAFFDYQDSQCLDHASDEVLEVMQTIAEVIMEADFDDTLTLQEGKYSEQTNARAVLELVEDLDLTRDQIDQIWEELKL